MQNFKLKSKFLILKKISVVSVLYRNILELNIVKVVTYVC